MPLLELRSQVSGGPKQRVIVSKVGQELKEELELEYIIDLRFLLREARSLLACCPFR